MSDVLKVYSVEYRRRSQADRANFPNFKANQYRRIFQEGKTRGQGFLL